MHLISPDIELTIFVNVSLNEHFSLLIISDTSSVNIIFYQMIRGAGHCPSFPAYSMADEQQSMIRECWKKVYSLTQMCTSKVVTIICII